MNALADEYPAHMRTVAVDMNAWPMLQFPGRDNLERFEEIAARFDLGSACEPNLEEKESNASAEARAAQPSEPQFIEEPCHPIDEPQTAFETFQATAPSTSETATITQDNRSRFRT